MPIITDQGKKLLGVQVVCLAIVWLLITPLRVLSRVLTKKRSNRTWKQMPWMEDASMFVALLLYTLMAGFALEGIIDGGIGKHTSDIPLEEASIAFRAWFICELIYGPLSAVVRTSIALLLLRLNPSRIQKRILYVCMAIVYAFTVVYFLINLLQCSPPSYFWEQFRNFDMAGRCDNPHLLPNAAIAHSVIAAASDLVISILSTYTIARSFINYPTDTTLEEKRRQGRLQTAMVVLRRNKTKGVIMIFLGLGST
ncbi:hypothetical protein E5D57_013382 [Metarhizium anisopliae]|nr:hypothetical protein E5D57_013382 [Metarhizium anisopliae]